MAVSPSRCLAQAAWVLESLLWKPERGAGSKWQAEGSEGRTLSYSADKPSSRVPSWSPCPLRPLLRLPSCPLSPPLLRAPVDPLTSHLSPLTPHASPSHRSPTATARTPTASPPKQPNIQTTPSAADSALFHRLRPAVLVPAERRHSFQGVSGLDSPHPFVARLITLAGGHEHHVDSCFIILRQTLSNCGGSHLTGRCPPSPPTCDCTTVT
ncbi:hypothetical protein F5882DRAFT_445531 [Hyaloscypha sp. PMI_1271]|nr:hypothetical protein F5882DRAFT_445531 [Hyaloscypha sp. PMI_1271]